MILTDTESNKPSAPAIISRILFFVYIIAALAISVTLFRLSLLPLKYLLPIYTALVVFAIIFAIFVFKKTFRKAPYIICIMFETLFAVAISVAFFYLAHTMGFFDSIKASNYQIEEYYVLVKKDSEFENIEDLTGHSMAIYDDYSVNYKTALSKLEDIVTTHNISYENLSDAISAIIAKEADSLFVKGSLISVYSEIFTDFTMENYRILHTVEIKIDIDTSSSKNLDFSKDSFTILISGIDTFGDITTISRSDVNILLTVNPRTHAILLTSIPRDYEVQLHGTTGLKDKLTHSGFYGVNMTINTIKDLLSIDVDYYIRINFDSTIKFIDAIGGVEVTPDATFYRPKYNCYFEEGVTIHLDGPCALTYARERKVYGLGDLHRIQNQQDIITAVVSKLTSSKAILTNYVGILSSLSDSVETNIPSEQIYRLINMQLDSMPSWKMDRITISGTEIHIPTYTIPDQDLFVFQQDPESITAASTKIHETLEAN